MCSKETIEKIDNGKAIVVSKGAIQWTAVVAIVIFILTQAVIFGVWKGGMDEKIDSHIQANTERFDQFQKTGSEVAVQTQRQVLVITHNLKRLMEKQGVKWQELE